MKKKLKLLINEMARSVKVLDKSAPSHRLLKFYLEKLDDIVNTNNYYKIKYKIWNEDFKLYKETEYVELANDISIGEYASDNIAERNRVHVRYKFKKISKEKFELHKNSNEMR